MKLYRCLLICGFFLLMPALFSQDFTESNLPIVFIETNGQTIPDEPKINVTMGIVDNGPEQINYVDDDWNDFNGTVGIEIRGSSSQWFFPKDQYAVETRDSAGNNLNVSLLGLPPENDWILYAPYSDKSLMRNVLIYKLARDMGHYASRTIFVELLLNEEYQGIYVLMEKVKRDPNRVDIAKMDDDDLQGDSLTGGYILKIDKETGASNDGWDSSFPPYPGAWQTVEYKYHYPKPQYIETEQKLYIQQFIYDFESLMDDDAYNHPETGYQSIADMNSFVDYVLLNELAKDVDAYRLSTYLHKDRSSINPKFKAGPVWDFNIALGNADYFDGFNPENWKITEPMNTWESLLRAFWWKKLMDDPYFYHRMVLRWNQYRLNILSDTTLSGFIDETAAFLEEPQQRNFERWPILGVYIWPNYFIGETYEEEVDYLKVWIEQRVAWMDEQLALQPMFTEINYFSSPELDAGDWIELYNPSQEAVDLGGWTIRDSSDTYFTFSMNTILLAENHLLVCEDINLFNGIFPDVVNVLGDMENSLPNQYGHLVLYNDQDECVDLLSYKKTNPWPVGASGTGNTIELMYFLTDNSVGENWQVSQLSGGSPGDTNTIAPVPDLLINEFMADNQSIIMDEYGGFDDWIELYNAGDSPVDLAGKYFTDDLDQPDKFQIAGLSPQLTTISAGGFLLLWADNEPEQGVLHLGFKLSMEMEQIGLYMTDGITVIDTLSFGEQSADHSYGRYPDGDTSWTSAVIPTPGYSNMLTGLGGVSNMISIYPNPTNEYIYWNLSNTTDRILNLKVYNLHGMLLQTQNGVHTSGRLNVRKLPDGVYLFVLEYEGRIEATSFVKQN